MLLKTLSTARRGEERGTGKGRERIVSGRRRRRRAAHVKQSVGSSLSLARSLSHSFALALSLSLSLSLSRARARARILLRGARHEALESAVRHFAVDNERRTHLKTATVESRTGDVIFQILRELSAKFCGELALFFRRQTESAGWRRWTITSPKFNTFRLLQRAPTPESRKFAPCVRVL